MSKGLEVINSMVCLGSQKQFSVAEAQNLREEEVGISLTDYIY